MMAGGKEIRRMNLDRTKTQQARHEPMAEIYSLIGVVDDRRDAGWERALLDNAWKAVFLVPGLDDGSAVCSLGGYPYLRLALPRAGVDYTGYSLSSIAPHCLDKGVGVAIYVTESDQVASPFFLISLGGLDALHRDGRFHERRAYRDIADVVRPFTARALHRHLVAQYPTSYPMVRVTLSGEDRADVGISLGLDIGAMTPDQTEPAFDAMEWCLPRGTTFRLLDVSAEGKDITPLPELF